ncbi:MAG: hypothetical protein VW239_04775 [Candidatus Nanopelagicales bacterium]
MTPFSLVIDRMSAAVHATFARAGAAHQRAMAARFRGGDIRVRSGALRRSLGFTVEGEGMATSLRVFAGTHYANIQEHGGTIRPKNKRFLTVPLPDALTPAGVLKGGARLVQRGRRYETADGLPTFIFRSKRGNLLVGARAKNGAMRLLYTLKPSVTLRPRLGFKETFERVTVPFLEAELERAAKGAVA